MEKNKREKFIDALIVEAERLYREGNIKIGAANALLRKALKIREGKDGK